MGGAPTFINVLRIWLGFVALMAFGNAIQCFVSETYIFNRIYTLLSLADGNSHDVSSLASRLFGIWTFLAGTLRLLCAFNINNLVLYNLTLFSYVLVQVHFGLEVFVFKTANITAGIIAPAIVSTISIVLMLIGYYHTNLVDPRRGLEESSEQVLNSRIKKKLH